MKRLDELKRSYFYLMMINEKLRASQVLREIRKLESDNAI
jgi:hypothetical protein